GASTDGSTRQSAPEPESPYHKWRTGLPVAGSMLLPVKMMPPRGPAALEKWVVLVLGVMLVWALARFATKASKTIRQKPNRAAVMHVKLRRMVLRVVDAETFTCVPSRSQKFRNLQKVWARQHPLCALFSI